MLVPVLNLSFLIAGIGAVAFVVYALANSDGKCDSSDCEYCPFPKYKRR